MWFVIDNIQSKPDTITQSLLIYKVFSYTILSPTINLIICYLEALWLCFVEKCETNIVVQFNIWLQRRHLTGKHKILINMPFWMLCNQVLLEKTMRSNLLRTPRLLLERYLHAVVVLRAKMFFFVINESQYFAKTDSFRYNYVCWQT